MEKILTSLKKHITLEIALLIVLGVLVGYYAKSLAQNRFTIGHSDPAIHVKGQVYNIDQLEQELISQGIPEAIQQEQRDESLPASQ